MARSTAASELRALRAASLIIRLPEAMVPSATVNCCACQRLLELTMHLVGPVCIMMCLLLRTAARLSPSASIPSSTDGDLDAASTFAPLSCRVAGRGTTYCDIPDRAARLQRRCFKLMPHCQRTACSRAACLPHWLFAMIRAIKCVRLSLPVGLRAAVRVPLWPCMNARPQLHCESLCL